MFVGGIRFLLVVVLSTFLSNACAEGVAGPNPGDVFREHVWRPEGKWQRVTGPETTEPRAREFLPNSVNRIEIEDLDGAVRAEIQVEMLLCHAGTIDKCVRVNSSEWIEIPESPHIPGDLGTGSPDTEYQSMRYPIASIPLDELREGENTFEFTCSGGTGLGSWWPQWILYGTTIRIYYDETKPHPVGRIVHPTLGDAIGENARFEADVEEWEETIARVDFLGVYNDFNWEGDGLSPRRHGRTLYGELQNHIGTASETPYRIAWKNEWTPDQGGSIRVAAKIVDATGLCFMTDEITDLRLERGYSVKMYVPSEIPRAWSTRADQTDRCKIKIDDDPSSAESARVTLSTWNGVAAEAIGFNGVSVVDNVGRNHDLSYDSFDVPLSLLREGDNSFYTYSGTEHHGIEVQWPGPVLFIRFPKVDE